MDTAKTLIKSVARTFYQTQHVLVIDALMVHSALQDADLAFVVNMQNKELRDLCGTLKGDRMLAVHSRPEVREGQQRPTNKDYYYVDFHATIDAIKYRVSQLRQKVEAMYDPNEEKKDYSCPRCKAQYTQIEVLDMWSATGFDCSRCGASLEREERADGASTGNEMSTKFATEMKPFIEMLQKIDDEIVPANDFDTAFSMAVPVQRGEDTNSKTTTAPLAVTKTLPTTVKGMTQVAAGPLDINLTSSAEQSAAEKAAEAKRKAAIAAQNTLPEWHAKSTVTGESVAVRKDSEQQANGAILLNDEEEDRKDGNKLDDELNAYYAQMAQEAENEKLKAEEPDSDDDEEEEDEDDFEDVGIVPSAFDTPSSSMSLDQNASREVKPNGILKRKESESGSSAPVTETPTPAASGAAVDDEEGPAAKKVKFEAQDSGPTVIRVEESAGDKQNHDSDEDDEADFEDAL